MIIECVNDLRQFNVFIFKKLVNLEKSPKKRDTLIDAIFKKAFKEFHMEIIGYEAVINEDKTVLKYRDLITIFEGSLTKVSAQEQVTFPTTLGVNAFRGFLNEFMHEHAKNKKSLKRSSVLQSGGRFFGANLSSLVDDQRTIPIVINKLFMTIELKALFVEGIYRKSAAIAQVEESFERIRCLSVMVELLPKCNKSVLDRLMYHLARVAHQESVNKMGAANLALIFAPCILRSNQAQHAQDQLRDVTRQAICVQALIEEKLRQFRLTLTQIIVENLRLIEEHKVSAALETRRPAANFETARLLFLEQLNFLDNEKDKLIQDLPPLAPVASLEDLSSMDENSNSSLLLRLDKTPQEEYALDFSVPPIFNRLRNVVSTRSRGPRRRPPSRQFRLKQHEKHFSVVFS
ncbi:unnamed protein product [Gongylonema pulchrum]|uniref:Rho-GAP domain-containing protein n=1 Tax=Gongylonema pulchrum TaxID=637853 RepID=A0A183CUY2_9BILA|nr:unnamed protein product [Gongylonema pulchrum]